MQSVDGKVSQFLYDASGILNGFVLDREEEIRFWISDANIGAVNGDPDGRFASRDSR